MDWKDSRLAKRNDHVHPDRIDPESCDVEIPAWTRGHGRGPGGGLSVEGIRGAFGACPGAVRDPFNPAILGAIMEHFTHGLPVLEGNAEEHEDGVDYGEGDPEIVSQIKEL